ncbi:MAG TPA: sugar phosphate isomerase/epimerase family protein [Stellaceae bacterium]|nr:sugar phosphate isomerase/epimerase family protein [Stellaceae bacterium]
MRLALCNEVIQQLDFARQCEFAAALGYEGLEVAPMTLSEEPHLLPAIERRRIRRAAADAGIAIASLHWLLVKPGGLSITSADGAVRARTLDVMRGLVDLAGELGAGIMVHGSPVQRRLPEGAEAVAARERGLDAFRSIAEQAEHLGIVYCIEPLSRDQTNFITTLAEAAQIVRDLASPAIRTMIDCSSAGRGERESVAALIDRWLPTGLVAHVQVNDRNRRGPGQGEDRFAPILAALRRHNYSGWVAVEPFDYVPDGPAAAARAAGYLRGIMEAQA